VRAARRVGPDGQLVFDLVAEVTQRRTVRNAGSDEEFDFYGGATIIIDPAGKIRYSISKSVLNVQRLDRQRTFMRYNGQSYWTLDGDRRKPVASPFRIVHDSGARRAPPRQSGAATTTGEWSAPLIEAAGLLAEQRSSPLEQRMWSIVEERMTVWSAKGYRMDPDASEQLRQCLHEGVTIMEREAAALRRASGRGTGPVSIAEAERNVVVFVDAAYEEAGETRVVTVRIIDRIRQRFCPLPPFCYTSYE